MATAFGPRTLPDELVAVQNEMEGYARDYGLDFFPTIFELVDNERLHALASFGGFPTRFPHWRFGMEYERLAKGYQYGLSKIYEMVINHDPCYAYLLSSNAFTDHKLVMAHVYGHCDFFKNNAWFAPTNRRMIDVMANHGQRVRKYVDRYGQGNVESFIDACLSLEDLIDIHSPHVRRPSLQTTRESQEDDREPSKATRLPAKSYMDRHINPPDSHTSVDEEEQSTAKLAPIPAQPTRDVLLFLLEQGPLESWQADILSIIRDEAYYFAPQAQTKIMNEGWATYWHSTIMTQHGMQPADLVCYADHCAGVLASSPTQLNPYKLGVELFRDIEDRWNRGRHGSDYDECTDMQARANWDTQEGRGREKIFEVRRIHNDLTFVDEFLTLEFCRRHNLFAFGLNEDTGNYVIESRRFEQVKAQLLFQLTNRGRPLIYVQDGNYDNRGELLLDHRYAGPELKTDQAVDTLASLYRLWGRPVMIESVLEEKVVLMTYDGKKHGLEPSPKSLEQKIKEGVQPWS